MWIPSLLDWRKFRLMSFGRERLRRRQFLLDTTRTSRLRFPSVRIVYSISILYYIVYDIPTILLLLPVKNASSTTRKNPRGKTESETTILNHWLNWLSLRYIRLILLANTRVVSATHPPWPYTIITFLVTSCSKSLVIGHIPHRYSAWDTWRKYVFLLYLLD